MANYMVWQQNKSSLLCRRPVLDGGGNYGRAALGVKMRYILRKVLLREDMGPRIEL